MSVFDNDNALPSLQIPSLEETCGVLKKTVQPILDAQAWEKTCAAVDKFSASAGALQALLAEYKAAMPHNASWLRPMWDDIYLSYRGSLPTNMNYCFELTSSRWGNGALSKFIAAMGLVIGKIRRESLQPEATKAGFLSMDALQHLIYTRIPCQTRDVWYNHPLSASPTVGIACKGHWFVVTLDNEKGETLPPSALESALDDIRKRAEKMPPAPPVSVFTTTDRPTAASARDELLKSPLNRMSLESIEECWFVVCLDDAPGDFAHSLVCGEGANRWFDKSLQIICEPGGRMGVNLEHSGCDAGIWVYAFNHADEIICKNDFPASQGSAHIRCLEWDVGKDLALRLEKIRESFVQTAESLTVRQRRITSLTRELIKSKKCSPDAFVQLLYQAAYYKEKKCFRSVYEAVSTRAFYQGRTECVRPVTSESAAFIRALYEGKESGEELQNKFRLAEKAHADGIGRSQKALGAERHLSGLQYMYAMYANTAKGGSLVKPELFECEGWRALRCDAISTSSTTSAYIDFFGFAPVAADGLGVGYGLKESALHLMVSSYKDSEISADVFLDNIESASKLFLHLHLQ